MAYATESTFSGLYPLSSSIERPKKMKVAGDVAGSLQPMEMEGQTVYRDPLIFHPIKF